MSSSQLAEKAERYLERLCGEIPNRRVGSQGNRAATAFFAETVASFGFRTLCPEFECIDWAQEGARLTAGGEVFESSPSPYSLGCNVSAPLTVVSTADELEAAEIAGAIVLLRGEIAKEQLMPKNFPFYNPDEHRRIISLLESKAPRAIIAATTRNPELAGAVYPFPLIEDGDFDIPSVYMTEDEGRRLARHAGQVVALESLAQRISSSGCNVVARKAITAPRRIVLCAHIDSKLGTPGALDNAAGVVTLLLLAELLADYDGRLGVEIVAINGEDYYAASGEKLYLEHNRGSLRDIALSINLDALGYRQGPTAYSLYSCSDTLAAAVRRAFAGYDDLCEGEPWYQSDHMVFVQNQVPALAITSEGLMEIETAVAHTPKDRPELVDCSKLVSFAIVLRELLDRLEAFSRDSPRSGGANTTGTSRSACQE
jgi:aminopeptidase YwaD